MLWWPHLESVHSPYPRHSDSVLNTHTHTHQFCHNERMNNKCKDRPTKTGKLKCVFMCVCTPGSICPKAAVAWRISSRKRCMMVGRSLQHTGYMSEKRGWKNQVWVANLMKWCQCLQSALNIITMAVQKNRCHSDWWIFASLQQLLRKPGLSLLIWDVKTHKMSWCKNGKYLCLPEFITDVWKQLGCMEKFSKPHWFKAT